MLNVILQPNFGIAILEPDGPLTEDDFTHASNVIDPYIERSGGLKGLLIASESFPGWESIQALFSHLNFIQEHHRFVERVAFVSDSHIVPVITGLAGIFVQAKIKPFSYGDFEQAKTWLLEK